LRVPPLRFLKDLKALCETNDALLIADEIYTGFGRTGEWFACEQSGFYPDLICLGKALTNGFPLSACVGRATVMDRAWPASEGEAIHTSTYLGHPVGCAMALAQLKELKEKKLITQARRLGKKFKKMFNRIAIPGARYLGRGLMAGMAFDETEGPRVMAAVKEMLRRGYILLPSGEHGNVITFSPPLTITEKQLERTLVTLQKVMA